MHDQMDHLCAAEQDFEINMDPVQKRNPKYYEKLPTCMTKKI